MSYIYVIGREQGPVKVGVSDTPERRLASLQTGCPFELRLLHVQKMRGRKHALRHERDFHAIYEMYHLRGEWFRCDAEVAIDGIFTSIETESAFEEMYGLLQ